jgi:ketosteroid isomerase-like protein
MEEAGIVDNVRRVYAAYNRGDFDAAVALAHPDIEFIRPGGLEPLTGASAVRAWMEPDAFERQRTEILDLQVHGNKALVHQRTTAKGAGSGIELDIDSWSVFTLDDDGRATRLQVYARHEEEMAREAAGLGRH